MDIPIIIFVHLAFMTLMVILEITAVIIARSKKERWFLNHKKLAISGVISAMIGFISLFIHKIIESESHFYPSHAKFGLLAILLLIITPTLGKFIAKLPKNIKKFHKIFGAGTVIISALTAISGYLLIFT